MLGGVRSVPSDGSRDQLKPPNPLRPTRAIGMRRLVEVLTNAILRRTSPDATSLVLRPGLRFSKPMRTKERPHQARCVDTVAGAPDEPFRQRLAAGPGVASSLNRIEHHRRVGRSEEHTSELQSQSNLVCRLLLEKKKI